MICITLWGKAASDDGGENDFMTEDLGFLVKMLCLFSTNIMAMFFLFSDKLDGYLTLMTWK